MKEVDEKNGSKTLKDASSGWKEQSRRDGRWGKIRGSVGQTTGQ